MARGSYLRRVAERAVPHQPALVPPRRVPGALPLAGNPDNQGDDEARRATPPAPIALATTNPLAPSVSDDREPRVIVERPALPPASPAPSPKRPAADFVFDAPPRQPFSERRAITTAPRSANGAETLAMPAARLDTDAPSRSATPPVRSQTRQPPLDPVAATLAAALQWTTSPDRPAQTARPAGEPLLPTTHRDRLDRTDRADGGARPQRPVREHELPREIRPHDLLPPPRQADLSPRPAAELRPARIGTPRDPQPPERVTGVHIGSVEVQILPPADPLPARTPAPRADAPTPAARLAREFSSPIGLRQS